MKEYLLTDEEILQTCLAVCHKCQEQSPRKYAKCFVGDCIETKRGIAKAQDAKTASIKDAEYKAKIRKMAEHIAKRTGQLTQAEIELQRVRQEMVEEIEEGLLGYGIKVHCPYPESDEEVDLLGSKLWQELKRKWGVK